MGSQILSFRDLRLYQKVFALQQKIFQISKARPKEERYALTDQIRRSSRSVGAGVAESWAKRKYPLHFISKLTDADGELQESSHWLTTALACEYISEKQHDESQKNIQEIGKSLGRMMSMPEKFIPKN